LKVRVNIDGHHLDLSNLDKVFWPDLGLTKADLIRHYTTVGPFIIPHLRDRPLVMSRYPDGVEGETFYQKECPEYAPEWVKTVAVPSTGKRSIVNYIVCNDLGTLLWAANQACIEMHPWLSRVSSLDHPDLCVLDLDPNPPAGFADARQTALIIREILARFQLRGYPKISGATGIHIYLNVGGRYSYQEIREALGYLAALVVRIDPDRCTIERKVADRGPKVYIDYLQNVEGKTIASVYSVRPIPKAPVSTPVDWSELEDPKLSSQSFHMGNIKARLKEKGDLFHGVLTDTQSLDELLRLARDRVGLI